MPKCSACHAPVIDRCESGLVGEACFVGEFASAAGVGTRVVDEDLTAMAAGGVAGFYGGEGQLTTLVNARRGKRRGRDRLHIGDRCSDRRVRRRGTRCRETVGADGAFDLTMRLWIISNWTFLPFY